jgi:hypothetical protein
LEQRIGALRDGEVTHHGEPVGSMPLTVQPPRRPVVSGQFHDAFAKSINDATYYRYLDIVDDILASPEMQAIKTALLEFPSDDADYRDTLRQRGLSESVINWVLS